MTANDHKILFTALGFLAVILRDVPREKQALRATAIAGLIESFCMSVVPEAFGGQDAADESSMRDRMVFIIAGLLKTTGDCTQSDLEGKGFSAENISRHWPMAYALARVSLDTPANKDS
jgi:hypothetical protein